MSVIENQQWQSLAVYAKFSTAGGFNLRSTLQDLSRENIFLVINGFGIRIPDINRAYDEALRVRVLKGSAEEANFGPPLTPEHSFCLDVRCFYFFLSLLFLYGMHFSH